MASVFTYDPDPPRISSPWSTPPISTPRLAPLDSDKGISGQHMGGLVAPPPILLSDCGISKLEAEPQEGPTEYKLHLLLRPRRSFASVSTGQSNSDSQQSRSVPTRAEIGAFVGRTDKPATSTPTFQTRQNRLQHLTTQLLWRLQQSSPYHSSSRADLVLPRLPEVTANLGDSLRPEKLLPGLEESRGALYEIGVSDDGSFVGLIDDEMNESLTNLRAMAASLGCKVEILRSVIVGDCEYTDDSHTLGVTGRIRNDKLLVAEVLILPDTDRPLAGPALIPPLSSEGGSAGASAPAFPEPNGKDSQTEQLRISLTGSTTSGKSSLLGTLSTSTLDNGRGKSRLSLLKHRHEIASGITSSVAPELIGYQSAEHSSGRLCNSVVNYGCGNISSWNDIHSTAEDGRLVFLIDSAGHPRYRRTTVRGLISWAPHWTLCCIAADDIGAVAASDSNVPAGQDSSRDVSKAHLELCLKLDSSVAVVVTKYDLALRSGLRQTLNMVLSTIKDAGRAPALLIPPGPGKENDDFYSILSKDELEVQQKLTSGRVVPIILTSAVTGAGIGKLHALLRHLPIPTALQSCGESSARTIFHIDEVYRKRASGTVASAAPEGKSLMVVSGHLRYGSLSVGDTISLGPFTSDLAFDGKHLDCHRARSLPSRTSDGPLSHLSCSIPRDLSTELTNATVASSTFRGEYTSVRIISIRNLRLPVRRLLAGQVGTVGVEFEPEHETTATKLRKGMILGSVAAGTELSACGGFKTRFAEEDYHVMEPGALFNVYVASVRALAKIVTVEAVSERGLDGLEMEAEWLEEESDLFGFEEEEKLKEGDGKAGVRMMIGMIDVVFQFVGFREWIEVGAQALVIPANAVEKSVGLDGFVGCVTDVLG